VFTRASPRESLAGRLTENDNQPVQREKQLYRAFPPRWGGDAGCDARVLSEIATTKMKGCLRH